MSDIAIVLATLFVITIGAIAVELGRISRRIGRIGGALDRLANHKEGKNNGM